MKKKQKLVLIAVVVGFVLISLFFIAYRTKAPEKVVEPISYTESVLVAADDIEEGAITSETSFKWVEWPNDDIPAGAILQSVQPDAPYDLLGSKMRNSLSVNEPIFMSNIAYRAGGFMARKLATGMRAIAIEVDSVSTAGGFITPNDHVDILFSGTLSSGMIVAGVLLSDIRVLAIDQFVETEKDATSIVAVDTVTLEVTPYQTGVIATAQAKGSLTLALRPISDASTVMYRHNDVTLVRHGIKSSVMLLPDK